MTKKPGEGRKYDYMAVLRYIIAYKQAHDGNSPSIREIMRELGIPGTCHMSYILKRLQADGWIYLEPYNSRSIHVIGGRWLPPPQ